MYGSVRFIRQGRRLRIEIELVGGREPEREAEPSPAGGATPGLAQDEPETAPRPPVPPRRAEPVAAESGLAFPTLFGSN